jgi:hypothetical protein
MNLLVYIGIHEWQVKWRLVPMQKITTGHEPCVNQWKLMGVFSPPFFLQDGYPRERRPFE